VLFVQFMQNIWWPYWFELYWEWKW